MTPRIGISSEWIGHQVGGPERYARELIEHVVGRGNDYQFRIFLTAKGEKQDLRAGMNLGADDYLTKPVTATDLLAAVSARLERERKRPLPEFQPNFSSAAPLEQALSLTAREAEVLLWVAQGKSNPEISTILGTAENTIKKHLHHVFEKIGVDNRNAATVLALEILSNGEPIRAQPRV